MKDNQEFTSESALRDMEERYVRRMANDQYIGKYQNEVVALEELLGTETEDTDSGVRSGGSRPVAGTVPPDSDTITNNDNLTHSNIAHFNVGRQNSAADSLEWSNTGLSMYHPAEFAPSPCTESLPSGGYDGGTVNTFFGRYDTPRWTKTLKILEEGQASAKQQKRGRKEVRNLGGENVIFFPFGKKVGDVDYYPLGEGKRGEITLSSKTEPAVVAEFKHLVGVWAAYHREGLSVEKPDKQKTKNLPPALRAKLVTHKLIEGTLDEIVPTVQTLIECFRNNRQSVKELTIVSERAALQDFLDYFKPSTRVDKITSDMADEFNTERAENQE
ncbi:MAG: hypothetical protein LBI05_03040 [Planctomycetaceae bacterium]|jgi:hypothetical protein|nr:hypothetical protein [Planctomycetaceae bacterium]